MVNHKSYPYENRNYQKLMSRLTYHQAEKFILSREFFGIKLGLENIKGFLERLGNPQEKYKTVHIAGTNGKGSTAAMLESIFRAQGYRTGLYTSPHLVDFRERIQINGIKIDKQSVVSFIELHKRVIQKRKLTFFEVTTALALDYFARKKIDVAVIETGLGGRLDATNVLSPSLTMTTDIDFDHTEILGTTLKKISEEKAGIIKPGRPHLVGLLPAQAIAIFARQCQQLKSPLHKLSDAEFRMESGRMMVDFKDQGMELAEVAPALYGPHQLKNTALVLKAASIFRQNGLHVSKKAIADGIKNTNWPGRFQILSRPGYPTVVLDVAHNPGGVRAFVESFKQRFPNKQAGLVTGFVKGKMHQPMFDLLSEISAEYALVPLRSHRSVELRELLKTVELGDVPYKCYGSLSAAFRKLTKKGGSDDIICVVGSHYLVGEYLEKFGEKWPNQPHIIRTKKRVSAPERHRPRHRKS